MPRLTRRRAVSEFDEYRFTSLENCEWFNRNQHKNVIVEKCIDPIIDEEVPILRSLFSEVGWASILDISGDYYPKLVWEFYANIEDRVDETLPYLYTYVKGLRIQVHSTFLSELLAVPNQGSSLEEPSSDSILSIQRALGYTKTTIKQNRQGFLTNHIPLVDRLIGYFISSNIVPKKSGTNELRYIDMYLIHMILNRIGGISLSSLIISHMRGIANMKLGRVSAPYPVIITKIMRAHGVLFDGEQLEFTGSADVLSSNAMMGMFFVRIGNKWFRNFRSSHIRPHPRDPSIPEEANISDHIQHRTDLPESSQQHVRSSSSHLPSGFRQALSAIFDCFEAQRTQIERIDGRLRSIESAVAEISGGEVPTFEYDPLPPIDRSALDNLD